MLKAGQNIYLLAVRLLAGSLFMIAGYGKLTHIDKVISFFTSLGIPLPAVNAYFVGAVEVVGGALLLVGLFSRITGAVLSVVMVVAYLTAHLPAVVGVFGDPGRFVTEAPFPYLVIALLVGLFGPGCLSVDGLVCYMKSRKG